MNILIIGGTGPTGPVLIRRLQERGHAVTILHRGVHEPDDLPIVEHIHADPHFVESLEAALGARRFDTVFGLYGRLETLARFFSGRCDRFIAVGGRPIYAGYLDPHSVKPSGMRIGASEDSPLAEPETIADPRTSAFMRKMRSAEASVFEEHERGGYSATLFRYPYIYGPRALGTLEWSVVKRLLDGRRFINLPSAGLILNSRCAAQNAAHHLFLALERPEASGEIFNCADDQQYTLGQWVELIAASFGTGVELVDVPRALRWTVAHFLFFAGTVSDIALTDTSKARRLLGYSDVVAPQEALRSTIDWYWRNPVKWDQDPNFPDRFDYALEDQVKEALDELHERFAGLDPKRQPIHTYAHPKSSALARDEKGR